MKNLVPDSFRVPEKLITDKFAVRKLCASDVYLDYIAVMSSIDTIRKYRPGSWPSKDLTFEDDLIDLCWHQREFEHRSSFAYTVMNIDETKCLGCVYFYPPGTRGRAPKDSDVDVSMWVTSDADKKNLYHVLFTVIDQWIKTEWPFKHVHYTSKTI